MVNINRSNVEVMSPAGSYEALMAAINAGADSVYFGVEQLNMRARASNNFTLEDLRRIAAIGKEYGVRTYLTLNTILYDHDIVLMRKICDAAKDAGVTAVIASDIAAISYANSINLEVHISTQTNVSNIETVRFYAKFADVIVLARELTLQQVKTIIDTIEKEQIEGPSGKLVGIELFAHGALCVAISGKCYMSLATYNASANRGACLQNCRRSYKVTDEETGDELVIDNKYVMSPKDLCTIEFVDKIIEAGVKVLKIEGRGRAPEYVYTVTKAYKEAVLSCADGTYTAEKVEGWMALLSKVYNRGFWQGGYYLGKTLGEWSGSYGSKATTEKMQVGIVLNYFNKVNVAEVSLMAGGLKIGDSLLIIGPTTGVAEGVVQSIFMDDVLVNEAVKGSCVTIAFPSKVRVQDKVYVIMERKE